MIDVKGGDANLQGIGRRVRQMPPRILELADDRDVLLHLRPRPAEARAVIADALVRVWRQGGWTVYVDETRLLTDPRYLNLGALMDRLWLFAGSRGVQLVTATQAPRWVPTAMYDQAERHLIGRVTRKDTLRTLANTISDVEGADRLIRGLADFEFLYRGPEGLAVVRYPLRPARG